jgi:ribosome-associated protein
MTHRIPDFSLLQQEIVFTASRSGGPGGQHVNKVSTKMTLRFDVPNSKLLTGEEKERITKKGASRLTDAGVLIISSGNKRSQSENKKETIQKLNSFLLNALKIPKRRKATKPSKGSVQNRLLQKKRNSEKKKWRLKNSD